MAMTDVMRAVKLTESGTPVVLEWITLGETATEGRFGVMAPADAPYSTLEELAAAAAAADAPEGFGVGVAANTRLALQKAPFPPRRWQAFPSAIA